MKKTKTINLRITQEDYEFLKKHYTQHNFRKLLLGKKHESFSDYIRYLIDLGLNDYY